MKLPILLAFVMALSTQVRAQSTWYVDGTGTSPGTGSSFDPYTSIRYAIEQVATIDGDTVLVRPGIYVENLDFVGKTISVVSVAGPELTAVSAPMFPEPRLPAVTFSGGEMAGTALVGFTLTNGQGVGPLDSGAGIWCIDASPRITDCEITGNFGCEGAVWAANSDLSIVGCTVVDNYTGVGIRFESCVALLDDCTIAGQDGMAGGGLELFSSDVDVLGCTFSGNSASFGSALYASNSTLQILGSEFTGNAEASAVWVGNGSVLIEESVFYGNYSTSGGGAALFFGTSAMVRASHFESNSAGSDGYSGGAILARGGTTLQVVDSFFMRNVAVRGGAVVVETGSASFEGCWFEENKTLESQPICCGEGGAILAEPQVDYCVARGCVFIGNRANGSTQYAPATGGAVTGPVVLSKCTIVGNYARDGGGGVFGGDQYGGPGAFLEDCIVYGNSPDQVAGTASVVFSDVQGGWPGTGNLDADPLFIDAQNDNYHLAPGSPCVDVGNRSGAPDLDGSRADVGAFQFVDCNGNGVVDAIDIAMGTSVDLNGNSFPDECECLAYNYCEVSPHSTGPGATMGLAGSTSISQNDFVLIANECPPNKNGIFFYGTAQHQNPFGDGIRCVFGQVFRLTIVNSGPQGIAAFPLNYSTPPQSPGQITAGSRWNFQFWFRDPMGPGGSGFNLSDGLEVVFCP